MPLLLILVLSSSVGSLTQNAVLHTLLRCWVPPLGCSSSKIAPAIGCLNVGLQEQAAPSLIHHKSQVLPENLLMHELLFTGPHLLPGVCSCVGSPWVVASSSQGISMCMGSSMGCSLDICSHTVLHGLQVDSPWSSLWACSTSSPSFFTNLCG